MSENTTDTKPQAAPGALERIRQNMALITGECRRHWSAPFEWIDKPIKAMELAIKDMQLEWDELLAVLKSDSHCTRCNGKGKRSYKCDDPQCGDSTWDHMCNARYGDCDECDGTGLSNKARAAVAKAEGRED